MHLNLNNELLNACTYCCTYWLNPRITALQSGQRYLSRLYKQGKQ
ncbi:hypothetical protein HCH_05507 [Hahella chejuensis KCTC 2396]|uniref:Uncharacterized protein n=1 Tax=Hahella chejuensis (strain KCTC 2396) TaxID=349521 RepID=Q2SB05_HAHCH|nr:hypothetical protein HCH_05507 [Hahella chejuensis KCTC 2396]